MEEILARGVQVFIALAGGYLVVLWFALMVWTYRDIGSRSQSVVTQIFATLLVVLFSIPGALLYLLLRPRATLDEAFQRSLEEEYLLQDLEELPLCPSCQRTVADDYVLCPHCQTTLRQGCGSCGKLVSIQWAICPYCGSDQSDRAIAIRERVEPPADRYLDRGERTFRQLTAASIRELRFQEPELEAPVEPELPASTAEHVTVAEELVAAEAETPIRLFDRKKTKAKKSAKAQEETQSSNGDIPAESANASEAEEAAVISQFLANGSAAKGSNGVPTSDGLPDADGEAIAAVDESSATKR